MSDGEKVYQRLSDKILDALNVALDQKDVALAELLSRAMEMSMTRNAGGRGFIERRDLSDAMEVAIERLTKLKAEAKGQD